MKIVFLITCALLLGSWTHGNPSGGNFLLDGSAGYLLDGTGGKLIAQ